MISVSSLFYFSSFSILVFLTVADAFLDFSVTVDKRPRNDIGQLNPINFGRGVFAVSLTFYRFLTVIRNQYMSSFHNRTAAEMWTRYTNFISANYGDSTGVLACKPSDYA